MLPSLQVQDITPWAKRLLTYLLQWAASQRATSTQLLEDQAAILQVLRWAAANGLWQEALRFASAIEEILALNGRWDAWQQVLQVALEAARAVLDVPAEAWALHQLGTRALCLGIPGDARPALIRALRLRESLEDYKGAAVTRHNLNILLGPPLPAAGTAGDAADFADPEHSNFGQGSRRYRDLDLRRVDCRESIFVACRKASANRDGDYLDGCSDKFRNSHANADTDEHNDNPANQHSNPDADSYGHAAAERSAVYPALRLAECHCAVR